MPRLQRCWWLGGVVGIGVLGAVMIVRAAPPETPAQQDGFPIHYGETVNGEITETDPCQYYWFEGDAGDPITLDMTRTSGSLDGVLALYIQDDLTQVPLADNDDRPGGGLDPLITITLPATDWYTIAACRLQAAQLRITTGTYDLTLSGPGGETSTDSESGAAETPSETPPSLTDSLFGSGPATATPTRGSDSPVGELPRLVDGSIVEGELAADVETVTYTLDVAVGDNVVIAWERTSGEIAPRLRVLDADGRLLAQAATPQVVSALELVVLVPADGALTLVVTRYGAAADGADETAGTFTLSVSVDSDE